MSVSNGKEIAMRLRLRFGILVISLLGLTNAVFAQTLTKHGEVVKIDGVRVEVRMIAPWQVKVGVEGTIFTTATIRGKTVTPSAAKVRVTQVTAARVICQILDQSATLKPAVGFGVNFNAAQRVEPQRPGAIEEGQPPDFYLRKGASLYNAGDYRKARLYFEKALSLLPEDTFTRDKLKQTDEAIARQEREEAERRRQEEARRIAEAERQQKLQQVPAWRFAARQYSEGLREGEGLC